LATSFETVGANEWLLTRAPYTHGEISFAATSATVDEAIVLRCPERSALFMMERVTLDGDATVTTVRILLAPGTDFALFFDRHAPNFACKNR